MKEEIVRLQEKMKEYGVDYYIVTTSDPHCSEYVSEYDKERKFLSGFTGSNGDLVVGKNDAYLWTDGRYFVQAEKELKGSGIELMKMGEKDVPTVGEFLGDKVKDGDCIGFNGYTFTRHYIETLKEKLGDKKYTFKASEDLADMIWNDRPERSHNKAFVHDIKYAGVSVGDKIKEIREKMEELDCKQYFINKLDDIMWLFNLRGDDVACNPVALSYAFISMDEVYLFLQEDAVTDEVRTYLMDNGVILKDYDSVKDMLASYSYKGKTLLDDKCVNYLLYNLICEKSETVDKFNLTSDMKSIKNPVEIEGMRDFFLKDSVAMTKYIYWLKKCADRGCKTEDGETLNELNAGRKCDGLRAEIDGFMGISFETICAYGPNAAMMHYEATKESFAECKSEGMLLTDCGGQYPGATTDVTRTVIMGPVSEEEKKNFTLVAKGFLNLMYASFLEGCTGRNVDILARIPLWKEGIDYKCGTGHGVGYCLNVHEGPQNIRWKFLEGSNEAVLKPGMTVTDEPGVYIADGYGIRTENTLLIVSKLENSDGHFLAFEPLTFVPVDLDGIDVKYLDKSDIDQLNDYHKMVYDKVAPFLTEDEKAWLKEATKAID